MLFFGNILTIAALGVEYLGASEPDYMYDVCILNFDEELCLQGANCSWNVTNRCVIVTVLLYLLTPP